MENLPPPVINKPQINETSELFNQVQIKLDLAYNNINYILEIGFNKEKTEIVFLIDEEGKLSTEFYLCKMNLESAKKLSKYFLVCDSID